MKNKVIGFTEEKNTGSKAGNDLYRKEQGQTVTEDISVLLGSIMTEFTGTVLRITSDDQTAENDITVTIEEAVIKNKTHALYNLFHLANSVNIKNGAHTEEMVLTFRLP